jgi:hypothetical protein
LTNGTTIPFGSGVRSARRGLRVSSLDSEPVLPSRAQGTYRKLYASETKWLKLFTAYFISGFRFESRRAKGIKKFT